MSTVQEKRGKIGFKSVLLRQGSLDKIKCCAYQLGSMFPQKSLLTNILEDAMNSSRAFIQKPVVTIVMPTIQLFCVAMSLLIKLIRNQKFAVGMSFEQKLDKFIIEFNQLKAIRQRNSYNKVEKQTVQIDKVTSTKLTSESTPPKNIGNDDIFNDCSEQTSKKITAKNTDRLLIIASYSSIIFVYAQFTLLLYLIGLSTLKLGMLFMLFCATAIGYLITKMSFKRSLHPSRRCSRKLKAVKQKLFSEALTFRPITCLLPQLKFNTCTGKFQKEKQKSL